MEFHSILKSGVSGAALQLEVTGAGAEPPEDPPPPAVPPEDLEGIDVWLNVTCLMEES